MILPHFPIPTSSKPIDCSTKLLETFCEISPLLHTFHFPGLGVCCLGIQSPPYICLRQSTLVCSAKSPPRIDCETEMSDSMQALVNHFQTEFVDGSEDAHADFLADVESWTRVHGLVMGNGQVRRCKSTWKILLRVRHLPRPLLRSNTLFALPFRTFLSLHPYLLPIPFANNLISCNGNSVAIHFVSFASFPFLCSPLPSH